MLAGQEQAPLPTAYYLYAICQVGAGLAPALSPCPLSRSVRKAPYGLSCNDCHWRRSCRAVVNVSLRVLSRSAIRERIELSVAIYSSSQRTMASLLVKQISRYISGLPAARRETSRKPLEARTEASPQPPLPATVFTRALEARKGRWLTPATCPSCSAGSRKRTRAPIVSTNCDTLLTAVGRVRAVGVRQ